MPCTTTYKVEKNINGRLVIQNTIKSWIVIILKAELEWYLLLLTPNGLIKLKVKVDLILHI